MTRRLLHFCLALTLFGLLPLLSAQKSKEAPVAPVPTQITDGRKIFIANDGGLSFENIIDQTIFNGGPDRPYNQFYAAIKDWNQREIVSSPADSDLVLQINWILSDTGLGLPVLGKLQLLIIDPKTHVTLWNITEYVRGALLLGNRDKNFDHAMTTVVGRLKALMAPEPSPLQK
jgi:hypothetical protein